MHTCVVGVLGVDSEEDLELVPSTYDEVVNGVRIRFMFHTSPRTVAVDGVSVSNFDFSVHLTQFRANIGTEFITRLYYQKFISNNY